MGLSRKDFLQFVLGGVISSAIFFLFKPSKPKALPRPPGAITEEEFVGYCARCYRCIDVCEPMALRPAEVFHGVSNIGTPVLDVTKCIMCMECIRACPTGAIKKVPKDEVDIGTAVLNEDICLAWLKKKRCKICYKDCPMKAIDLKKKRYPVIIDEKCNGCAICIRKCPTSPKSIILSYEGAKRFDPPVKRLAIRLEDRVGPYEVPPPDFKTWFFNRLRTLAENYGLIERK